MSLILAIFANFSFGAFSLAGGRSLNTFAAQFPAEAVAAFEFSVNNVTYVDEGDVNAEKIRKDAQSFMDNFDKYYVHDDDLQRAEEQYGNYKEVSTILHDAGFLDNAESNENVIKELGKSVFDLSNERTIENIKFAAQAIAQFLDSVSVANLEDAITAAKYVQENAAKDEAANDKGAAKDGADSVQEKGNEDAKKQQEGSVETVEKTQLNVADKNDELEETEVVEQVVELGRSELKSNPSLTKSAAIEPGKEPADLGKFDKKEDGGLKLSAFEGEDLDKNDDDRDDDGNEDVLKKGNEEKNEDFGIEDFSSFSRSQYANTIVKAAFKFIISFVQCFETYVEVRDFALGDRVGEYLKDFNRITYRKMSKGFSRLRSFAKYLRLYSEFLDKSSKRKDSFAKKLSMFVKNTIIPLFTEAGGDNSFYTLLKLIEEKSKSKSGDYGLLSKKDYNAIKKKINAMKTSFNKIVWEKVPKKISEKRRRSTSKNGKNKAVKKTAESKKKIVV